VKQYRFQEGEFELGMPLEDGSVNLLVSRDGRLSLFVSRLPTNGLSLDALVARRLNDLRRALPGFVLCEQEEATVDGVRALSSRVVFREKDGTELVQQMIATVLPPELGGLLLTLGVTGPRVAEREVGAAFRHVARSARLRASNGARAA
jgi:hypothetical protein